MSLWLTHNYEKTGGAGVPPATQSAQARRLCHQFFTTSEQKHAKLRIFMVRAHLHENFSKQASFR